MNNACANWGLKASAELKRKGPEMGYGEEPKVSKISTKYRKDAS
jgi:hypothetical protein